MIILRPYTGHPLFSPDYLKVREFLIRINQKELVTPGFPWSRWEWVTTHRNLDRAHLNRISLWEEDGRVVALATYETDLGDAYLITDPDYARLKEEMVSVARRRLARNGSLRILVEHQDLELAQIVRNCGFAPTSDREETSRMSIPARIEPQLPEGFRISSMVEEWSWPEYHRCMWRGFNHGDEPDFDPEVFAARRRMLSSPCVDAELVLVVISPDGRYVAHCGMWHRHGERYAYVEPVATDPLFRRRGLGRAVVLENIRRCRRRGADIALVGSAQNFYYQIGFAPYHTASWWTGSNL